MTTGVVIAVAFVIATCGALVAAQRLANDANAAAYGEFWSG